MDETMRRPNEGLVFDIQKFCVHDGPGIRTVVFLKGCNLRCSWCQNPESISFDQELSYSEARCIHCGACIQACPNNALLSSPQTPTLNHKLCKKCMACVQVCPSRALRAVGEWMTIEEVMGRVEEDRVFYENSGGGVTYSGGEPVTQFEFLRALLAESGRRGFHRALETNGYIAWEKFVQLLSHVELVLFDLKHLDSQIHKRYVGVGNRLIITNLRKLAHQNRADWIVRIPFIPGVNSDLRYLERLGQWLRNLGPKEIHLLPYNRLGDAKRWELGYSKANSTQNIEVPSEEEIEIVTGILKTKDLSVVVGG